MLRFPGMNEEQRNHFIDCMAEKGVACNVHFKPLPIHTAYKNLGFDIRDYPNAYAQYANEVTIPSHTSLKDAEVDYVINSIYEVMGQHNSTSNVALNQLEFKRVWENEPELIETVFETIRIAGEEMFLQRGLMHWATPLPMDIIKDEVLQKEFYVVLDKSNNQPVAVFNLTSKPSPYYDLETKALYLHRIAVHPKLWRQGIGTAIYNWVKKRAVQEECQAIRSTVYSEDEVAVAFLKKLGYHSLYKRPTRNFVVDCMESPIMPIN